MEKPKCPRCEGFLYLEEVPHEKEEVIRCINCGHYITKSYEGYFDRETKSPSMVGLVGG
jgi:Zn ribbon nucleic-acid-binding protein